MPGVKNFAYTTVATAPSPATSGLSLVVEAGDGALFPDPPFPVIVWPTGQIPLAGSAEVMKVTAVTSDTLTIERAQEGTSARSVVAGDQIMAGLTSGLFNEVQTTAIGITIDGAGSAIATGYKGHVQVPYAGVIEEVTILADQTGSIQIDIWVDTYANFPPTDDDSICGSSVPAISSGIKYTDSTLSTWDKVFARGSVFGFNVDSASTITRATLILKVRKLF